MHHIIRIVLHPGVDELTIGVGELNVSYVGEDFGQTNRCRGSEKVSLASFNCFSFNGLNLNMFDLATLHDQNIPPMEKKTYLPN